MAKVFLDTNILVDLVEKRGKITPQHINKEDVYISPLSIHILLYITKNKVPYRKLNIIIDQFIQVPFDDKISSLALMGPTTDFEDNVQLHSAATAECDFFLTEDKKLLDLKFFGKTRIVTTLL